MGAEDWHDPHGIIPESFQERFGDCESVVEALRHAESARSTTPVEERKRCPFCGSEQVKSKSMKREGQHRRHGTMRCARHGCRRHFSQPADEDTILMTDERTDAFDWIEHDKLTDAEERGSGPLFASLEREQLVELVIRLYKPWTDDGPALADITELVSYGRYWVGERNREWKDGEHRELVPAPRVDPDPITVDDAGAASSDAVATDGGRRRWEAYGT